MSHENIIRQLDEMHIQHVELLSKLKEIRRKIGLLLSKKVDKKKEIEGIDTRYKKIIVVIESIISSIENGEEGIKKVDSSDKKTEFENYKTLFENYKTQLKELKKGEYNKNLADLFTTLMNDLENFNINLFGKIKVYIKIKPNETDKININSDGKTIINDFFVVNDNETINIDSSKENKASIESIIGSIENDVKKFNYDKKEFQKYKSQFTTLLKTKEEKKITKNDYEKKLTTLKNDLENFNINLFTFGPFSKVLFNYDKTTNANIIKNEDVFNEFSSDSGPLNINKLLGTSTILFGYGISGSGKSWTMFGKDKVEEGLISLSIKYLSENGITVEPIKIFEHYLDTEEEFIKNDTTFPSFIENKLKSKIRHFKLFEYLDGSNIKFDALNKKRENIFHSIRRTPNNDKSSRTHLFIIYKISRPGSPDGFIIFIDSAGKEEPLEIVKKFYTETEEGHEIQNPSLPFTSDETKLTHASFRRFNFEFFKEGKRFAGKEEDIMKEKKKIYEEHLKDVRSVIKEGFFINETLAHMINYFTKGKTIKMKDNIVNNYKSYNKDSKLNVFYNPPSSGKVGQIEKLEESYDKDPILTTTIFDYLTNLCTKEGDTSKKFKFIMLGHTRTEVEYRDDIIKTFKLIDFIKST